MQLLAILFLAGWFLRFTLAPEYYKNYSFLSAAGVTLCETIAASALLGIVVFLVGAASGLVVAS